MNVTKVFPHLFMHFSCGVRALICFFPPKEAANFGGMQRVQLNHLATTSIPMLHFACSVLSSSPAGGILVAHAGTVLERDDVEQREHWNGTGRGTLRITFIWLTWGHLRSAVSWQLRRDFHKTTHPCPDGCSPDSLLPPPPPPPRYRERGR